MSRYLITGTSSGIGKELAKTLVDRGDEVFGISRSHSDCTWINADLGAVGCTDVILSHIRNIKFDGIVFNHAKHGEKSGSQWSAESMLDHFMINTYATVALWQVLEDHHLENPCNVVLMGSFIQNGNVKQPAYAMSKAALWAWMRSYTMRQPKHHPVSMNMLWPGRVITPSNLVRELPENDPNIYYEPEKPINTILYLLDQKSDGPRGRTLDLGRS